MKKLTLRQRQGIETKLRITKIAMNLFQEKGYSDVTIRDICQTSSISIGSFYHHFESKDEIINTAYNQLDLLWEEKISVHESDNPKEDILFLYEEAGNLLQQQGWELSSQSYTHLPSMKTKFTFSPNRPIYRTLLSIVQTGIETHVFYPETDPVEFVETLMRCSRGVVFDWCLKEGNYTLKEQMRYDLSLILNNYCI